MQSGARYREIEVSGPPRELGRQIGEALRDEIRGFCDVALANVNKTVRIPREAALQVATASVRYAQEYSAEMVEELRGMAEAAHVTLEDLMLLQVRNQLRPEHDAGCTSLALTNASAVRRGGIVAQNWDNDPDLDDFTVVLTRRTTGKPAVMNLTQAGLIAYIGFNEAGIGVCLNTLPAPSRKLGVPHYFTVRGIYETDSLPEAVEAVRRASRAIPANIMLTTPQGPADLEVTIDDVHVLQDPADVGITHTNHCLHPELAPIGAAFPELIQSRARKERIDSLLDLSREHRPSLSEVETALRDHTGYPRSICRHANDDVGTGYWQTVFSVIIEPQARRMFVSRGTPCDHAYEEYRLS